MPGGDEISRAEWRRVALFAVAVMLVTAIPYIIGALAAGAGWTFGGFVFGADDGYSYLAKMRLGARGDWLFTLRYTHEPHGGALLLLHYLLLGKLAALFVSPHSASLPAALIIAFHAARIACGFALILVTYRFIAVFLRGPATRMLALVLIALGGGLGWPLALAGRGDWLGSLPVDFYVPEGYSFLILFGLPHLALARAALLGGLLLLLRASAPPSPTLPPQGGKGESLQEHSPRLREGRGWGMGGAAGPRWALGAGLCWVVVGLCVPFYLAVIYAVLGAWGLAAWGRTRRFPWALFWPATVAALVTLPPLASSAAAFLGSDVLGTWSAQNRLPSPHPLHYVLGYVALAIPAALGWRWAWRRGGLPHLLLTAWVIAAPVLAYLPVNVQRRLLEGAIVPLGILAAAGLRLAFPRKRAYRRARAALLALTLPAAVLLWLGATFTVLTPERPLFQPDAELRAMDALNRVAPRDAVVLSLKETGNVLPAWTDLKAYVGHGPETVDAERKEAIAQQFFAGALDVAAQRDLLAVVDYVFVGQLEMAGAGDALPAWADALPLALPPEQTAPVRIYEVPHE
ncbi:MAG: hypothetical protein KJ047_03610 [Anaerolineae bacterium]|nr:hypothetical protein [Anaerolineae bacterium]